LASVAIISYPMFTIQYHFYMFDIYYTIVNVRCQVNNWKIWGYFIGRGFLL